MKRNELYKLGFVAAAAAMLITSAPARATDADDAVESSFKNSYVYRTYLKDDSINSEANNGIVTLTGTVSQESHKTLAQDTAAGLPGVIRVDNQLATKAEVAADNSDAWMGRKIDLALRFHRNVNAGNTTTEVKDGVVTLTGEASSLAQKELTSEYANDIEGVRSVNNQMTVSAAPQVAERTQSEKMDDASITAQVRSALQTHRSTSAITTKVETRDGTVTLTGIARNEAEKALVTKLVTDIQGVTNANNEMTIAVAMTK